MTQRKSLISRGDFVEMRVTLLGGSGGGDSDSKMDVEQAVQLGEAHGV